MTKLANKRLNRRRRITAGEILAVVAALVSSVVAGAILSPAHAQERPGAEAFDFDFSTARVPSQLTEEQIMDGMRYSCRTRGRIVEQSENEVYCLITLRYFPLRQLSLQMTYRRQSNGAWGITTFYDALHPSHLKGWSRAPLIYPMDESILADILRNTEMSSQ